MCTAVPPPSPLQPPKYVPNDPSTPSKPTVHGPYSAKTLRLIRENHGGGVQYLVDGVLNRGAMYRFAVQQPKKNPLRLRGHVSTFPWRKACMLSAATPRRTAHRCGQMPSPCFATCVGFQFKSLHYL